MVTDVVESETLLSAGTAAIANHQGANAVTGSVKALEYPCIIDMQSGIYLR